MYKFTEEEIQVATPRKILTLSYTGRVDLYQCYFKDIKESNDTDPKKISPSATKIQIEKHTDVKPTFMNAKQEERKSGVQWGKDSNSKEDVQYLKAGLDDLKMSSDRKQVSFSDSSRKSEKGSANINESKRPKGILKSSSSNSPTKNKQERKTEKQADELEKSILTIEESENRFLETIQDSYSKLFLKTQFSLANDVNKAFRSLNEAQTEADSNGPPHVTEADRLKHRLYAYILGSHQMAQNTAKEADTMRQNFDENEKIQNYWNAIKNSENQSNQQTSNRLGDNNLMSRKIEETILKGERMMEESSKFVHIVRSLTKQARSLNDHFSQARTIKMKGGLNDPFLKKYKNSGVLSRLMQENKNSPDDWKEVERKLRGPQRDIIDSDKIMRVYNTFIDELKENNGYLLKVLDQNYARLITKMKDYEIFNESLEYEKPYEPEISHHKFDFSAEIKGSSQPIVTNQKLESPGVPLGLSATSLTSKDNKGLIEVKDGKELQQQFQDKLAEQESKKDDKPVGNVKKIKMETTKKDHILEQDSDESSSDAPEVKPLTNSLAKSNIQPLNKEQRQGSNKVLKEKKANAQKINMLVQDDMSFGDSSSEESDDTDEYDDTMSEMRPNGKLSLKKLQTTVPDNLRLE